MTGRLIVSVSAINTLKLNPKILRPYIGLLPYKLYHGNSMSNFGPTIGYKPGYINGVHKTLIANR